MFLICIGNSSALLYFMKDTGAKSLPCLFGLTSGGNSSDDVGYYLILGCISSCKLFFAGTQIH